MTKIIICTKGTVKIVENLSIVEKFQLTEESAIEGFYCTYKKISLCFLGDDWHKLFECRGSNAQSRPSVIKVRRLLNLISKLKNPTPNGIGLKPVTFLSDTEDSREIHHNSDDDPSDGEEISGQLIIQSNPYLVTFKIITNPDLVNIFLLLTDFLLIKNLQNSEKPHLVNKSLLTKHVTKSGFDSTKFF